MLNKLDNDKQTITNNIKLSIILPCFNEAKNIPLILEKFSSAINRDDIEVILVNNGSSDESQKVLNDFKEKYNFLKIVHISINQGYGHGIVSGLKQAQGEYIGYTHADMQADPKDVLKALKLLENQNNPKKCYIKGLRQGRALFDNVFTIGMSLFETIYLKTKLWDINAQPNIFHKSFYEDIKESVPKDFSLDLYFLYMAKKQDLKIIRFDVFFKPRIHGKSSWNDGFASKYKFIKRTLAFSFKLKKYL